MKKVTIDTKVQINGSPVTIADLWKPEWTECVGEPGIPGAEKYGLDNYLEPEGKSIRHPRNCDSMFHHLAREFVYQENKEVIDYMLLNDEYFDFLPQDLYDLLKNLKFDSETKVRHVQAIAWRGCAGYTREKRGLPK